MSTTKLPRSPEREVLRSCLAVLDALGIRAWRRNVGSLVAEYRGRRRFVQFSEPGQADIWAILPDGRHLEIEVKRRGRRPSTGQLLWLRQCCALGAVAFWVDDPRILERVMRAVLAGGVISWRDDGTYDVEMMP